VATLAITSFNSGAPATTHVRPWRNPGSIVPVVACAFALGWLVGIRRRAQNLRLI
jgi:hypothetical protein